ncbi:YceI family protein [Sediminibacterium roseum]|uniref:YceI family protein n=1 Tax=Sediminibacterium roseum TaxID=1978412 RepID=A0ABW9ZXH4_9BACT|nr:YceI family protein [Sediminibacterium roseum]NCI49730.1 YceI family protein [Sediminibacterium roseum]
MKKIIFAASMLLASAGLFSFTYFADTLTVDATKSKINWSGSAADHYHPGSVAVKSGTVTVDNGKITGGSFTFDMATVKVLDEAGDRLEGHLKSASYFDVAKFGEASYTITGVNYVSDNTANISGNMVVKGATVPVSFLAKIRGLKDGKLFAEANFSLDLSAVGIKNGIDIAVHLFANK